MLKILAQNKITEIRQNDAPFEINSDLQAIAQAGSNVSHIPIETCSEKGVVVFNTPGASANAVKELALTGLFLSGRKIIEGIKWMGSLKQQTNITELIEKGRHQFDGPELAGKTLGVIGLGDRGVLVANACRYLGMRVLGYDPYISIDAAWGLSRGVRRAAEIEDLLEECDYISVHATANMETEGMFNSDMFAKCKKGLRLLNFSKADVVDSLALKEAIDKEIVSCYVTDYPSESLIGVDKIIAFPHLGSCTPESADNCATMATSQLEEYLLQGNIKNSVNFPECYIPYVGKKRVCIIHRNVAKMVGPITSIFADKAINIDNMLGRSKGEYAYTMIDIDGDELNGIEEDLLKISNIIKVRVI